MKFTSFLENLYFGDLDKSRLKYGEVPEGDPVVEKMVAAFLEASREYPPAKLEEFHRVPEELLERLRKTGFFGMIIPKEYGGVGMTLHQYLAAVERIVRADMALGILSLAHLSIGVKGIILFGNEQQKRKYLPRAASGEMIFCYALTEPLIGSDAKNIQTTAELSGDNGHYLLNGTKTFITNANYSGGLTVFAQMDKNKPGTLGAFIVETAWEGVTVGKDMEKMGLVASSTASIQLKNVKVPKENLIGGPADGFKIAMTILNYGRLALGAASSGMLIASYEDMKKRAASRVQFGAPLDRFELIQEKILKAYVHKEVVSAITNLTAGMLADDPVANAAPESSHCKLYGTNRAWETLYNAMQVAGGSGYLKSMPYEKRMRDFRVATIFEGTTEIHSIYPPLFLARDMMKMMGSKNALARFLLIAGAYVKPVFWTLPAKSAAMKRAVKVIKKNARRFRSLFLKAVLIHGPSFPKREFLLRRLTVISTHVYALLALVMRMQYLQDKGEQSDDLNAVVDYFTEEVIRECGAACRLKPDRVERKHRELFSRLAGSAEAPHNA